MGAFYVNCELINHVDRSRVATAHKLLVDTGSKCTWIPEPLLREIGIQPEKKRVRFVMANGKTISRNIGFVILRLGEHFTTDEVVFAKPRDLNLLGSRTLEGMNLKVDPLAKKLVAGGPMPAATASAGFMKICARRTTARRGSRAAAVSTG